MLFKLQKYHFWNKKIGSFEINKRKRNNNQKFIV